VGVLPQLFKGDGFEQFFKGATTSGQGDDGIGLLNELSFAFMHVGHDVHVLHFGVIPLCGFHEGRDDANDMAIPASASVCESCFAASKYFCGI